MKKHYSYKSKKKSNSNPLTILVAGLIAVLIAILALGTLSSNKAIKTS